MAKYASEPAKADKSAKVRDWTLHGQAGLHARARPDGARAPRSSTAAWL